jgi:signal transduction histidine kinase
MEDMLAVLVIDDNVDDRTLYRRVLKKAFGDRLSLAEEVSGESGFDAIAKTEPRCVLLDYSLPGQNGIDVLKRIRSKHPHLAVILLTGQGNEAVAVQSMKEGAQDYITKATITPETLSRVIRVAMEHSALQQRVEEQHERMRERTAELGSANAALKAEIAERKQIEAQLIQAQKMEAIGNLTGGMAHDFNNLLGVIVGNLDVLHGLIKDNAAADELAGEALDAALRGAELTSRLLAFARRQPLRPARLDVNDLIDGVRRLLTRTLGEDIEIVQRLAPGVWPIVADPAQLEAALTNLATNARDAMPKGGRLAFTTANRALDADYAARHPEVVPGDYAMIEVSDTGAGIAPDVLTRIFEPFFTTKEQGRGTGLGLSMTFGFMKQSGGHINVYSEVGVGTTFRLYLPRDETGVEREQRPVLGEIPLGHGEVVLAVEDDAALRRIVARQARELGYSVLEAENAVTALALMERERVDLLFTDLVMPGEFSGLELARAAAERWPHIRVVLTSGFSEPKINAQLAAAAARLLTKPYRKEDLARALHTAIVS